MALEKDCSWKTQQLRAGMDKQQNIPRGEDISATDLNFLILMELGQILVHGCEDVNNTSNTIKC